MDEEELRASPFFLKAPSRRPLESLFLCKRIDGYFGIA